jgi:sigma-E factor negative regulatory protein RseC
MIEERVRVVETGRGFAWVETQRRSACGACGVNKVCGTGVLARTMGQRRKRIRVLNDMALGVGDQVVIGIREGALVKGSMAVYVVPLLFMFLGALFGELVVADSGGDGEGVTILLGLAGLLGGLIWVRFFGRAIGADSRYQPVVLKRTIPGAPSPIGQAK